MNIFERFREAWAVFRGRDHPEAGGHVTQFKGWDAPIGWSGYAPTSSDRPDRMRMRSSNERTIINAIYNKIALDVAQVEIHHAKVDDNEFFKEIVPGKLEDLLTVETNIDQTAMNYTVDLVMSMFDEGVVAEVPINFDSDDPLRQMDPAGQTPKDIEEMRIGRIVSWKPREVEIEVYNSATGEKQQITMGKREVCIHENPFYSIMNEKNSIFQRLVRKLNVLDVVDQNYSSDKLNMIMQLPYIVRTDVKRKEANDRLHEVENQLGTSPHGIAWVDGTEKIIQLNRPIENNLQAQVEWLTNLLFSLLGLTQEILNGTADEKAMANYMNRCVGVVLEAICSERKRKLLTPEQRQNGESIVYVQDPLRLIPATSLSDIFDKLSRNAILSPNECRGVLGYKPSEDPSANKLVNRNMPISETPNAESGEAPENESEPEFPEGQTEEMAHGVTAATRAGPKRPAPGRKKPDPGKEQPKEK